MASLTWEWIEETKTAIHARALAAQQIPVESTFWSRKDLLYLGDLNWTGWSGEGYEYIADVRKRGSDGFEYSYGLVGLSDQLTVGQSMVCQVRDTINDPLGFEMYVGKAWQVGPLSMWLETLTPAVQIQAKERYRNLVAWIRQSLQD
jgi:hypothetical protein